MRATICIAALALGHAPAFAQTPEDRAAAEALFHEGRDLARAKRHAEACPKFEASQRLDPGIGTELNLADCYEQLGRLASAWGMFRQATDEAHRLGDVEAAKIARERAAALAPRLGRLTIQPPRASIPDIRVVRDGVQVDAAALGTAVPIDPGLHKIECHAPGRRSWSQELTVHEGDSVVAAVPVLAVDPRTAPGGNADIQIVADDPRARYEVELATTAGVLRCGDQVTHATPCKLVAPPGLASLRVRGGTSLDEDLTLKGRPVLVTVARTSRLMRTGGFVTAAAGAIALGVGGYACATRAERDIRDGTATGLTCVIGLTAGGAGLAAGAAMLVLDSIADHHALNVRSEEEAAPPSPVAPPVRPNRRGRRYFINPTLDGAVLGVASRF